jgi:hypothetical protein
MVEFAVVVSAFLTILFAAISAAFHSLQRAMAETAAASGIQVAASAPATNPPSQATRANLTGAIAPTEDLLRSVMYSTTLTGLPNQRCPAMDAIPQATLLVCTYQAAPGRVGETIRGHPAYPVPFLASLLPWTIDVTLEMHQVGFQA